MCGILGIVGRPGVHVNQILYDGLTVLQHRGQDAAGMLTEHHGQFILRKSNGQVADVFDGAHAGDGLRDDRDANPHPRLRR